MFALVLSTSNEKFEKMNLISTPTAEDMLVADLKEGNEQAIKKLYAMYAGSLNGIIRRIIKVDEVAEDVLQDTFVKIWKSISQYDSSKGKLFTWMANVAKNLAIDQVRSKAHYNFSKTDDIHELPLAILDSKTYVVPNTETIGVKQLINHLKPEQQLIIDMIYFQGYTHVQTSEILNIPLGTIKTKIRLSIIHLRKYFCEIPKG